VGFFDLLPAIGFALLVLLLFGFLFGLVGISVWGIRVQSRAAAVARSITTKDIPSQQELIRDSIDRQARSMEMQQQALELQREAVALLKKILDAIEARNPA
jgi:hypothetical protein